MPVFLQNLEIERAFLQHVILGIDDEANGNRVCIVPCYFVLLNGLLRCTASVFRRGRVWEMPFDEGRSVNEGDIVEIENLSCVSPYCTRIFAIGL